MLLTKHAHACVTLEKDGARLVIDPGTFTPDAAQRVADAHAVLITHEHFDHFDEQMLGEAISARPELQVYGPAAVVERWSGKQGQVVAVADGDRRTIVGFDIAVSGTLHAQVHREIPQPANVGYLVDGALYHPGDAYHVPPAPVETLLLPTSGPWTKLAEAVDYVREVAPSRLLQIHELMASELGQQSTARVLSPGMLSPVALTIVPVGDTITV